MISSMTGYGRGEATRDNITAIAEVRSVNSRFLEVSSRLPRTMTLRENDIREQVRTRFVRGKVNVAINIAQENASDVPLKVNASAVKAYYNLLVGLRKQLGSKEKITLDHLLKFPEVLEVTDLESRDEKEWVIAQEALLQALDAACEMRQREGAELMKDLSQRILRLETMIRELEQIATGRLPDERQRMTERVQQLLGDSSVVDKDRLELEISLLADKLDVTEECVRFRSHNKFFLEGLNNEEAAGRKLNFLIQEMNREANTIGAKASNAEIAHIVVGMKEELEKIREQLQNIE